MAVAKGKNIVLLIRDLSQPTTEADYILYQTDFSKTISKVGIVRYSAFRDTGSDLSFTLALLNKHNDGVVLNGIYSREMSNIYAKPIKNAESTYTLSNEEKQAIQKALESK